MMNCIDSIVERAREAEAFRIDTNPATIRVESRVFKDNGFGRMVPDLTKSLNYVERNDVMVVPFSDPLLQTSGESPVYGIGNRYMLVAKYDADWLYDNLTFTHEDRRYRIEQFRDVCMFGEVISRVATLVDVTEGRQPDSEVSVLGYSPQADTHFVIGE